MTSRRRKVTCPECGRDVGMTPSPFRPGWPTVLKVSGHNRPPEAGGGQCLGSYNLVPKAAP